MLRLASPCHSASVFAVVRNPTAGSASKGLTDSVVSRLRGTGCHVDIHDTHSADDAKRIARELSAAVCDVAVAAGGDGTINQVINGLYPNGPTLGIIPAGTANVLAAEIGLKVDLDTVTATLLDGHIEDCFLGRIDDRLFVQMASVGFDAKVVAGVNLALKEKLGKAAYVVEALWQLTDFDLPMLDLHVDGVQQKAAGLIAANGRFYGGRFLCAPGALLTKPSLEFVMLGDLGRWPALRYGVALGLDRLPNAKGVTTITGQRLDIGGPAGQPIQADGDIVSYTPTRVELAERPIKLLYPPTHIQSS